jgi:hypothetical protein
MAKISVLGTSFDCPLRDSLTVIRQIHVQLHVLTGMTTTPKVLASRIELFDVLLGEISGIRSNPAKDIQRTRQRPPLLN